MTKFLGFSLLMLVFAGANPSSEPGNSIEEHLAKVVQSEVAKECETCRVELFIHNKKILDDIAVPDKVIADRWRGQTNLVLQMGKDSRIVTVTIRWKDQVVVAKSNIRQGQLIEDRDVRTFEKDVTFQQTPYLNKVEDVVGWEPRKMFRRGQVIDEGYLKRPLIVKYGQNVKVTMDDGSLQVTMSGVAKGAGSIGDRIPVFLPETGKRLAAIILEKGIVRVQ